MALRGGVTSAPGAAGIFGDSEYREPQVQRARPGRAQAAGQESGGLGPRLARAPHGARVGLCADGRRTSPPRKARAGHLPNHISHFSSSLFRTIFALAEDSGRGVGQACGPVSVGAPGQVRGTAPGCRRRTQRGCGTGGCRRPAPPRQVLLREPALSRWSRGPSRPSRGTVLSGATRLESS